MDGGIVPWRCDTRSGREGRSGTASKPTTSLVKGMIDSEVLLERVRSLPVQSDLIAKLEGWVRRTARDLSGG